MTDTVTNPTVVEPPPTLTAILGSPGPEGLVIREVDHAESYLVEPPPTTDKARARLRAKGYGEQAIDDILAVTRTHTGRQRRLPIAALVCSREMEEYWGDRTEKQKEEDTCKAIRGDGGILGPTAKVRRIIDQHASNPQRAAEIVVAEYGERIAAIRRMVVALINEKRRVDAVASGVDPMTVKYLSARPFTPTARPSAEPRSESPEVEAAARDDQVPADGEGE
jgi:hypothetical protein